MTRRTFFSLYINDIIDDNASEIRLFAGDCVCYRQIQGIELESSILV